MIERPTDAEWIKATAGIIGVEKHYEDIGATGGALEVVRAIEKCLRYADAALGWQKIGTAINLTAAPWDGKEVLVAVKVRAGIPNKLLVGHYMRGGHCIEDHPPIDAGFYFWNGCMFDRAAEPTHWRPLDAPPRR